jgi:hypothetical protein
VRAESPGSLDEVVVTAKSLEDELPQQLAQARGYRWLHQGLHRLDFTARMRIRPWWDAFTLLLMLGVTTVCVTGTILGYRRLTRKASAIKS